MINYVGNNDEFEFLKESSSKFWTIGIFRIFLEE